MDEKPQKPPRANALLSGLKEHRVYGTGLGYLVAAWIILQVAAIVLPGFGAPAWALRLLMIVLALGFGGTLLIVWGQERRRAGLPLLPRAVNGRVAWLLTALLPAALVAGFFLLHPLARPVAPLPPTAADKSVAVLPFDNFSEDKDSAVFADAVQDEVIIDLCKVADLKAISRSSVMQYKKADARNLREIGRTLGVTYVVEGGVQRAGNKIKVSVQLIDTRTDSHRWGEQYIRDLSDVFAIQSEIAQAIVAKLQAAISPQEKVAIAEPPTRDLAAYELYLKARQAFTNFDNPDLRARNQQILQWLTQATARDPAFARAYALIAELQSFTFRWLDSSPAQDALALKSAEDVSRVRPGSMEARKAMCNYYYYVRRDYRRAREEAAEAVRLAPNDAEALQFLAGADYRQGLWTEAAERLRRACELDPEDENVLYIHAVVLQCMHRYDKSVAVLDRWLTTHPAGYSIRVLRAKALLAWKGDPALVRAELARLPPGFDPEGEVTFLHLVCDWGERNFPAAVRDLAACPRDDIYRVPRAYWEAINASYAGDPGAAKPMAAVRLALEARVNAYPTQPYWLVFLAEADLVLGRRQEAETEARRAVAICPPEQDHMDGPDIAVSLASVLARVGKPDEAFTILQTLAAQLNGPTYGNLHLTPEWEPLRGDPRFEALVASLAPKP